MNKATATQQASTSTFTPSAGRLLQRKCACGNHTMAGGECTECAKKKTALQRKLTIGASNDPLELEADRVADQVVAKNAASLPVSNLISGQLQREEAPKEKTNEEKLQEGLKKLGEAFLETPLGKELLEKIKQDELAKGATDFISTWPGMIVTGAAATGAVAALAANHKELPAQIPEIPLDSLIPGLSVKLTYRGPVDKPTEAMITFKFTEQAAKNNADKKNISESDKDRAEADRIAADRDKFQAGLRYPPGSPEDLQQKAQQEAIRKVVQKNSSDPMIGAAGKKYPMFAAPQPESDLQLTMPKPSFGVQSPSLLGDEFKLRLPGEQKRKLDELPLQRKLSIGVSNDPLEQEADRVADQVMAAPRHSAVNTTAPRIQRFTGQASEGKNTAPPSVDRVLASSGRPLEPALQQDMEQRFGYDFSHVRVHTGSAAEQSARDVNANAYTMEKNVVFGVDQFQPRDQRGLRLLAHELVHTIQQQQDGRKIPRQPKSSNPDKSTEANNLEKRILARPEYLKLASDSKATILWIIARAKTKTLGSSKGERIYYLNKLEIAITTPFDGKETGKAEYGCSPDAEKENREEVKKALDIEGYWKGAFSDLDETMVASGINMVKRKGEGGKIFTVDRTDPRNIRVKIKVKLNGKPDEVGSIKKLEDAIERAVSIDTKGYYLDIEFADTSGPDVFEFTVNFCLWANSGNWASGPVTLSHEVHHALGLGDRYDYIESHASNTKMNVPMRLVWFAEQMKKTSGPRDAYSKMDTSTNPLLAEDVCAVAFDNGPEQKKCIEMRKDLDPQGIPSI